jgi:hypothetical protein
MPTSNAYADSAWFPTEILELFISQTWNLPLSPKERIQFMTSSMLVSRTWNASFLQISSKTMHIPSVAYADYLCRAVDRIFTNYDNEMQGRCESINISIPSGSVHPVRCRYLDPRGGNFVVKDDPPMGKALSKLLSLICCNIGTFPNLRTLRIEFQNMLFEEAVDEWRFLFLPWQVTDLVLTFTFDPRTPVWLMRGMREASHVRPQLWPKSLCRIILVGAGKAVVKDLAGSAQALEGTISVVMGG